MMELRCILYRFREPAVGGSWYDRYMDNSFRRTDTKRTQMFWVGIGDGYDIASSTGARLISSLRMQFLQTVLN